MNLSPLDIIIFAAYGVLILGVGLFVSRNKEGHVKNSEDYFLAGKSLPWWAIGASLIAANISAEQFIGMSGSGFALGLAIASYEWMGGFTLIIVGNFKAANVSMDDALTHCQKQPGNMRNLI